MSSAKSTEGKGTLYRRPSADLFTALLLVALLALLVGFGAMYAFMADYEYKLKGGPSPGVGSRPAIAAPADGAGVAC
jgi:hypothetical protein